MQTRRAARLAILFGVVLAATAAAPVSATSSSGLAVATATIRDANGATMGQAAFVQQGDVVLVAVRAAGLAPGLHGLHVHAVGSCVGPSFTSAGAHFNPTNTDHGAHAGDLPDLVVNAAGFGLMTTMTSGFTLLAGPLSLFDGDGAAIVIHANPDDHHTNPSGNSGARIGCGVIQRNL
jgi:Cu-Zn family superoxide dismutase